jgi:uncharacterized membrane protein YedE/YeeE
MHHVWDIEELVALIPEPVAKKRGPYNEAGGVARQRSSIVGMKTRQTLKIRMAALFIAAAILVLDVPLFWSLSIPLPKWLVVWLVAGAVVCIAAGFHSSIRLRAYDRANRIP